MGVLANGFNNMFGKATIVIIVPNWCERNKTALFGK